MNVQQKFYGMKSKEFIIGIYSLREENKNK